MSVLQLHTNIQNTVTLVDNTFIDQYMLSANGEYVKVYLLLLRHLSDPKASLSIAMLADQLEHTEGDILRALKYWEKEGLLTLGYHSDQSLSSISFGSSDSMPEEGSSFTPSPAVAPTVPEVVHTPASVPAPEVKPEVKRSEQNRHELKQILFITEQYLAKTLTRTDVDMITYFYDTLAFPADLIEYLIEYCVENGHKSMHYIQKVALAWADENITTVEQARNSSSLYNKTCYSILNAFGIKGRGPASSELEYIRKWTDTLGLDLDLILEACNRTMKATHQPSFQYADSIITNWKSKNVRNLSDVRILDSEFEQEKEQRKKTPTRNASSAPSPSKFRNFEERSYDMSELTKELLLSD